MNLDPFDKVTKNRSALPTLILMGAGLLALVLVAFFWLVGEMEKPQVVLGGDISHLGLTRQLSFVASDAKSGLRSIEVALVQENKKALLFEKNYPRTGYLGGAGPNKIEETIEVTPKALGFKDGAAELVVTVADFSWWNWFRGNVTVHTTALVVDTKPPVISVMDSPKYIKGGGAGVVVYRVSEPAGRHGVLVNDIFYPGFALPKRGDGVYGACMGLPYDIAKIEKAFVVAADQAGNEAKSPFTMDLHVRRIVSDKITISDDFLSAKLPEFADHYPELAGTPVEQYIKVNNDIRQANYKKIQEICAKFQPERFWDGRFGRMEGSPRAGYADRRTYLYNGEKIDEQVHLGVDIASLQHANVEAANRGQVIFAEYLGIYGNTVILDHGQGIFSLYSHLSQIDVQVNTMVEKGSVVGLTGTTGMAGGDHLHFSILVNGIFVDPIEWWDEEWLKIHMLSVL
ncbi:MAG: M23 family metallopeptidase [Desulfobulbaceae bacterium]|nr:M23 family metallopeptidase [Desulfobulbaceae bacterium]HIJ89591.1 M23 family metallopeptidase [Deltaproteobacteria bacterium]